MAGQVTAEVERWLSGFPPLALFIIPPIIPLHMATGCVAPEVVCVLSDVPDSLVMRVECFWHQANSTGLLHGRPLTVSVYLTVSVHALGSLLSFLRGEVFAMHGNVSPPIHPSLPSLSPTVEPGNSASGGSLGIPHVQTGKGPASEATPCL